MFNASATESPRHPSAAALLRIPRSAGFVGVSASLLAVFAAAGAPTPLLPLYERNWGFAPSMLTLIFGVYAIALIVALIVAGSLSDYIGRRPVLIGVLALELAALIVLFVAPSVEWLIVGRILQGIATGVASSTFGAAILELASQRQKKAGALMSSLATTAGLGVGALFSGLVAVAAPTSAAATVWIVLIVIMAAGTALALVTPETSTRRPGAAASLVPRVAVPAQVRRLFALTSPSIVTVFLETALFLGLVPTILARVFEVKAPLVGGVMVFVMFAAATIAAGITGRIHPHQLKILGNAAMALGAAVIVGSLAVAAVGLMWTGTVLAGLGMGAAFSGSLRGLLPEAKPHERAGLLAAVFTVAYLTLGGSAIIAGYVANATGVEAMAIGFAIILMAVALVALLLSAGLFRSHRKALRHAAADAPEASR